MPIASVLLVDDDEAVRAQTQAHLRSHGVATVLLADSVAQGLQLARESYPDVILLDAALPGLDVAAFVAAPRDAKRPPAVILLGELAPGSRNFATHEHSAAVRAITRPVDLESVADQLAEIAEEIWFTRKLVDLAHLGGPAFVGEMIDMFVNQGGQDLATIRAAVTSGDCPTAARAAHSLKSGAANLGAEMLRDAAGAIETQANQHAAPAVLLRSVEELQATFDRAGQSLRQHRPNATGGGSA